MTTVLDNIQAAIRYWWTFLVANLFIIAIGVLVLMYPVAGYVGLSVYFAIAILVSGIINVVFSLTSQHSLGGWGWYLVGCIIDFVVGAYLLIYPAAAILTLPVYVGFWLLFRTITIIGSSVDMKALGIKGWGWYLRIGGCVLDGIVDVGSGYIEMRTNLPASKYRERGDIYPVSNGFESLTTLCCSKSNNRLTKIHETRIEKGWPESDNGRC